MSARCTGAVFERYPTGGGEMLLALALADNAHDNGAHIFISVESMAVKSRQSVRSVQAHLRAMLASGWLQVVKPGGGAGHWTEYRINPLWIKGAEVAPFSPPPDPQSYPQKGAEVAGFGPQKRVQNDVQKGADFGTAYITRLTNTNTPLPPKGGERVDDPEVPDSLAGFDGFWTIWPKKVDQQNAMRAWAKLAPDAALQGEIAQAIHAWTRSPEWQADNGHWIPKPSKWLRGKRWRDILGLAVPTPPPAPTPAPEPAMTLEQLRANRRRAEQAATLARTVLLGRREAATA
jgi:hypothetical protein